MNKNNGKNSNLSLILALLALMLVLAAMFIYISSQNTELKNELTQLKSERVMEQMKSGTQKTAEAEEPPAEQAAVQDAPESAPAETAADAGTLPTVSSYIEFVDNNGKIVPAYVIYDNGNERMDFPIIEGAKRSKYDFDELTVEQYDKNRRAVYDKDGKKLTKFGIDVSKHQGEIDWNAVAADGVEFAIIRAGVRGYETGNFSDDTVFMDNYRGAKAAGLDVGAYFFSQATNADEGREEAEHLIQLFANEGCTFELPVFFDWERIGNGETARTDDIADGELNNACAAFCETIENAGYTPAYYTNIRTAFFDYDISGLPYRKWIADYGETNPYIYDYSFWQYSESGVINGINAFVDLNLWFYENDE